VVEAAPKQSHVDVEEVYADSQRRIAILMLVIAAVFLLTKDALLCAVFLILSFFFTVFAVLAHILRQIP
jgi:hypothetical protein